ncbi:MAG: GAF domain-containing sensor histidine kinase [Chloroflexota bacterium]|nr:GAF domain-containing sensor histidine kinase [Chloroflexota bacterium]
MITLTRKQLEDRLASLHHASLQLVSDLSRNNVLERIVRMAREQVDAHYAAIGIVDENGDLEKFIHTGMTEDDVAKISHPPEGSGLIGAIIGEQHSIRIADIAEDARSEGFPPNHPQMSSFLGVPIMSGGRMLGHIYLTDKENAPEFTDDDEVAIETLAAYAAVAIVNSRLFENVIERDKALLQQFDEMTLLYDLAKNSAHNSNVDEILDQTLNQVIAHFGVQAGEVFLQEEDNGVLWQRMHCGEAASAFCCRQRFEFGEGIVGRSAKAGKPLESTSLEAVSDFLRPAVIEAGFKHLACIPLLASNRVIGVMTLASRTDRQHTWRELDLLETIGNWLGTAIENARLQQQSRRLAILEERERIGMDLHDGIIQSIYGIGLALDYARISIDDDVSVTRQKINESIDGLNDVTRDIRVYVSDLRPRQLRGDESLPHGVQRLLDEFRTNTNAKTALATGDSGIDSLMLPRQHALTLFHICQESLANVAKHAQAQDVEVQLWSVDGRVLLKVTDNGRGFDTDQIGKVMGHGLSNMHRRARKVGGDVEISSKIDHGTTILAWVPWNGDCVSVS